MAIPVSRFLCLTFAIATFAAAQAFAASSQDGDRTTASQPPTGPAAENRVADSRSIACALMDVPPSRINTVSKYDQSVESKSVVDNNAAQARQQVFAPITQTLKQLSALAGLSGFAAEASTDCAGQNLLRFARSGSFTDMASEDANLSRDRFITDIGIVLASLRQQGEDLSQSAEIRAWLTQIGDQTMAFYDWQAGPTSRRNNHRYWGGLSVGMIGYFLQDARMVSWAKQSFEVGACQIDARGLLPLEMARGRKALDYHVYAYRALAGFESLAKSHGDAMAGGCEPRLALLENRVRAGLADPATFEGESGYRQDAVARDSAFLKPLLISTLLQRQVGKAAY